MTFAIELSGAAVDTLHCLFLKGPTFDGDLPSKSGRDDLVKFGLAFQYDGYQSLTKRGVKLALKNSLNQKKEIADRLQRERNIEARRRREAESA